MADTERPLSASDVDKLPPAWTFGYGTFFFEGWCEECSFARQAQLLTPLRLQAKRRACDAAAPDAAVPAAHAGRGGRVRRVHDVPHVGFRCARLRHGPLEHQLARAAARSRHFCSADAQPLFRAASATTRQTWRRWTSTAAARRTTRTTSRTCIRHTSSGTAPPPATRSWRTTLITRRRGMTGCGVLSPARLTRCPRRAARVAGGGDHYPRALRRAVADGGGAAVLRECAARVAF